MKKLSKLLLLFIICTFCSVSAHAQQNVTASLTTQATACASPPVSGASGYVYVIQNAGNGGGAIAVSGTWSGTLSFFRGVKQSNSTTVIWSALSTTDATPVSTTTANGTWQVNTAGYTDICVAFTTASSGTAVVTINLGQASARSNGGGGGGGGISIAANQLAGGSGINTVGAVPGWTFGTTTGEDIDCLGGTTCAEILSDTAGDDTAINSNSLTWQNSLAMNGTTATQDASGNLDISSPIVVTGTTAGFLDLPQGTTSAAVAPCNVANSICEQAPTSVTSYLITRAGAASTGLPHYANSANVITETISAITSGDATGNTSGSGNFCLVTNCVMVTPILGAASATSLAFSGSTPGITLSGTTPYLAVPLEHTTQCSFALTTSTLTLALSPVSLCTITLPNAAVVWRVNCQGGWSVPAGTTPTFAVGNNWAQTPSGVFAGANIGTTNAGVAVEGTTSSTSNGNIVATGSLTTSATIFPVTWWSTFTGSATSGAYHPTASLTGTSATGTLVGFCTIQ